MVVPDALVTSRLNLRPLTVTDARALHAVYCHTETIRFWHESAHRDIAATRAMIADALCGDGCWWAICPLGEDRAIGVIYLLGTEGRPGMGYILHHAWWQQGYMTEAVRAVLAYGFDSLGLDGVELWIHSRNVASQKLAEKLGFTRRGRFARGSSHADAPFETVVYGLFAWEWRGLSMPMGGGRPRCYGLQPVLAVPDVQATAEYYRDRLDFRIDFLAGEPPTYGSVSYGEWSTEGARIRFRRIGAAHRIDPSVELYIVIGSPVDELYDRYRTAGVYIVEPPVSRQWQDREFIIQDCNGYLLYFSAPE